MIGPDRAAPFVCFAFGALLVGCSSSAGTGTTGTGGATAPGTGGAAVPGTGGANASVGTGGSSETGGSAAVATGGDRGTGGAVSSGGSTGTGGAPTGVGGASSGGATGQAGTSGAGGAPTPSANCPAGALLCEGFESFATMVPLTGRFVSRANAGGKATVVVDTMHPHSGTKAVHFSSPSITSTDKVYIFTKDAPFPIMADRIFVRFMMYINRFTAAPPTAMHTRIAWVGPSSVLLSGANGAGYAFATYNGIAIERILDPNKGWQRDTTQHMEDAARQGKWQCFEFELDNKGGVPPGEKAGSTMMPHIWQDGKELSLAAGGTSDVWQAVSFESLQFSLWCQQTDPMPSEYWLDDIVVSTQRINCP